MGDGRQLVGRAPLLAGLAWKGCMREAGGDVGAGESGGAKGGKGRLVALEWGAKDKVASRAASIVWRL